MNPFHERKILNVPFGAGCNESNRNQPRLSCPLNAITFWPRPCFARLSSAKKGQFLHSPAVVAIMPTRKTYERNVLVWIRDPVPGIAMFWRKSQVSDTEPC